MLCASFAAETDPSAVGCFADNRDDRVLGDMLTDKTGMSPEVKLFVNFNFSRYVITHFCDGPITAV